VTDPTTTVDLRKEIMQTALEELEAFYGRSVNSLSAVRAAGSEYACRVRFGEDEEFEEYSIFLEN
jgi:hypothetical protein